MLLFDSRYTCVKSRNGTKGSVVIERGQKTSKSPLKMHCICCRCGRGRTCCRLYYEVPRFTGSVSHISPETRFDKKIVPGMINVRFFYHTKALVYN